MEKGGKGKKNALKGERRNSRKKTDERRKNLKDRRKTD